MVDDNTCFGVRALLIGIAVVSAALLAGCTDPSPAPEPSEAPSSSATSSVSPTPEPPPRPAPEPEITTPEIPAPPPADDDGGNGNGGDKDSGSAYYANCSAARAAGAAPLHVGDPGYRAGLDRDGDGTACE